MAHKVALVNYYARLLRKGYDKKNIPEDLLSEVEEAYDNLPPLEHDPETETPELKE